MVSLTVIYKYIYLTRAVEQSNPDNKVDLGQEINESFLQAPRPALWPYCSEVRKFYLETVLELLE